MENDLNYRKVKTHIPGLDKLLFDGLNLSAPHTVIVIKGDERTERTLLGLQLIYGIGQSLCEFLDSGFQEIVPRFISTFLQEDYMDDLLLDVLISSCIQRMTQKSVSRELNSQMAGAFIREFFETDKILCQDHPGSIYGQLPIDKIEHEIDKLIREEAIYYNNRTNALHFRSVEMQSDEKNVLYLRRHNRISGHFKNDDDKDEDVKRKQKRLDDIGKSLGFSIINTAVRYCPCLCSSSSSDIFSDSIDPSKELVAIDFKMSPNKSDAKEQLLHIMEKVIEKVGVAVFIIPDQMPYPEHLADIVIEMKTSMMSDYLLQHLSITKNRKHISALGWHQYKRRDYGIEVYPSLHTYFQQRRYLQRALVYTHSDVITETFQRHLEKKRYKGSAGISYGDYEEKREQTANEYYQALYPQHNADYTSVDILERILLSDNTANSFSGRGCRQEGEEARDHIYGYRRGVTAIIGESNTYKRFLTYGGIFSSALDCEHTLLLLLNKDDAMIRRRLACPARSLKDKDCKTCKSCYSFIHFMNVCMGNITPDEFIYFLERQIEVAFSCGKKISRIVIDDLQILDFCFPLLRNDSLFLSALVSVCREKGVALYLLCDKNGKSVPALRAVADNVICTDKDETGKLEIYIERFAGYKNSPSKIYCGRVKSVKELFECYTRRNDRDEDVMCFGLNSTQIEDRLVPSMDLYWISREAKMIIRAIKK